MIEGADLELFERSLRAATERHTGASLDAALADLGWAEALADDPRAAVSMLFSLQGAANATSSALARVVGSDVLPAPGTWTPPGSLTGGPVRVDGLVSAAVADRDTVTVVATVAGDGGKVVSVDLPVASLSLRPITGVDPWLDLVAVTGEATPRSSHDALGRWDSVVAVGRLAVGHELAGASRAMLRLAREHALERIQFDRPIATFQAVRHRLADTLVAVETAEAALDAAWIDGSPVSAAMAKALAGRGARTASRHCQQVLAGIGFTTEHPLHRYVRRVLVLDELLGSARVLTRDLGADLLATRQLPPLLPL